MHLPGMTVEDLLADQSFIHYCKGYEAETQYWEKFLRDNPEYAETASTAKQLFLQIFNAFATTDLEEQVEELNARIIEAPVIRMHTAEKTSANRSLVFKIAAALIIVVAGYYFWTAQSQHQPQLLQYATQAGEKKIIQLPDGSVITLNASSQVRITEQFGVSNRMVTLTGEAFFDVKKNKALPFIVTTRSMQVKALGTAFNIKAYPGEAKCETALVRGLVEVKLRDKEGTRVMLYPSQKLEWDYDVQAAKTVDRADTLKRYDVAQKQVIKPLATTDEGLVEELAWMENKLIFSDETFAEIAPELERWYGVTIAFGDPEVSAYRFTGTFEKESLHTVLDVLKESKTFHYKTTQGENQTVTISR